MGIELPAPKSHDMRITEHISQLHQQRITRVEQGLRTVDALPDGHSGGRSLLERMEHYAVPGVSIAVIDAGTLAWAKGYGIREAGTATPCVKSRA